MPETRVQALPTRSLRLHLRCRCCQRDAFRALECGPEAIVRGRDVALQRALVDLAFACDGCPGESAVLVGHGPAGEPEVRDAA